MWKRYQRVEVCYVYLADVSKPSRDDDLYELLAKSRWFTRGWTLQELIAPWNVKFFSMEWYPLGQRHSMTKHLSSITEIDVECLSYKPVQTASVAKRMSWASCRTTQREEDLAYCLLGLFNVDMPLIYGEGMNDFRRLQEEIIKVSHDHSLFAWDPPSPDKSQNGLCGLLATSPSQFRGAGNTCVGGSQAAMEPYYMTNLGLTITLLMAPKQVDDDNLRGPDSSDIALLNCSWQIWAP